MRKIFALTALAFSFASVAQAEFLIDDFDTGVGLTTNGAGTIGALAPSLGPSAGGTVVEGGTRTATVTGPLTDWREGGYLAAPGPAFLNVTTG